MHRLLMLDIAPDVIPNDWETKTINELRRAIPHGIVLRNLPAEDAYNPNDRHLDIYAGIRMKSIDPRYRDLIAKMIVGCRLSANGTLSIRTIDRQFKVE